MLDPSLEKWTVKKPPQGAGAPDDQTSAWLQEGGAASISATWHSGEAGDVPAWAMDAGTIAPGQVAAMGTPDEFKCPPG